MFPYLSATRHMPSQEMLDYDHANSYAPGMSTADLTRQNGATIRAMRRLQGLEVGDLAEMARFKNTQSLINIETEFRQASWEALSRIATALCVPLASLARVRPPEPVVPQSVDRKVA